MFKKKKQQQPPQPAGLKKAGPLKRAERRFFNIFNDKSRKRRIVLLGMLAYLPAMTIAEMQKEDPSATRQAGGTEQVQQYRSEIGQITRDSNTITIGKDGTIVRGDSARAQMIEARTMDLAARLANDTKISEKDAQELTRMFLRDMNDPVISRDLARILSTMSASSAFLEEARANLTNMSTDRGERAGQIISAAAEMKGDDSLYGYLFNYLIFFMLFQTGAEALLRRGSRRDDKLKKEEMTENFAERAAQIRAMLAPKGQEPRAAETPLPAPATKKTATRKPSRRTGSTGPR